MRILITGASGFLGAHVARGLVDQGHVVGALVRPGSRLAVADQVAAVLEHDGSTAQLAALVADFAPDAVVHMATKFVVSHVPDDIESMVSANVTFGCQLLDAMARAKVSKLINFGTSWQNFRSETYNPASLYAATKQAFEDVLRFYINSGFLSSVTLRLSDTYGPGDTRPKIVNLLTRYAQSGERLEMSPGEQLISFVHAHDVVEAVRVALAHVNDTPGTEEVFAVRGAELESLKAFVGIFEEATGLKVDVAWGARPYREREIMRPWLGDLLPGWSPRIGLRDGLRELVGSDV